MPVQRIDQLELGALVVDNTWQLKHAKSNLSQMFSKRSGITKPVVWMVVGVNHYDISCPHVTLLSKELLTVCPFDRKGTEKKQEVTNLWADGDYSCSLREFLSGTFAGLLPQSFKEKLLATPRRIGENTVEDFFFVLSTDELGGGKLKTVPIGNALPYFLQQKSSDGSWSRAALLEESVSKINQLSPHMWDSKEIAAEILEIKETELVYQGYWTCSPVFPGKRYVYSVRHDGKIWYVPGNDVGSRNHVRVAINIKADTMVSQQANDNGCFEIGGAGILAEKLKLLPEEITTYIGDTVSLAVDVRPAYASCKNIGFHATNEAVATVMPDGALNAQVAGDATIIVTASDGSGVSASCPVTVLEPKAKMRLDQLEIGSRVVDMSWMWEFKKGNNYSGRGEKKPVIWIVVAKNHYQVQGGLAHVSLLAEDLIANHCFEESRFRKSTWPDSGCSDGRKGLRPFLTGVLDPPDVLRFHVGVAGTFYGQRSGHIENLSPDARISLHREHKNPYDANAILVRDSDGNQLGFLPAEFAEFLAPLLDAGKEVSVSVSNVEPQEKTGQYPKPAELELCILMGCDDFCRSYIESRIKYDYPFSHAFSESFKEKTLETFVPNYDALTNQMCTTIDRIFIPSHTELNGKQHLKNDVPVSLTEVGKVLTYFDSISDEELCRRRLPRSREDFRCYWTRTSVITSIGKNSKDTILVVNVDGEYWSRTGYIENFFSTFSDVGVRPLVNISAEVLVHAEPRLDGVFLISQ